MKLNRLFLFFLMSFVSFSSVYSLSEKSCNDFIYEAPDVVVFEIVKENNSNLLRISFNKEEGQEATFVIYNAQNRVLLESNFELIKYPNYATVDISNLAKGSYQTMLTTQKGRYSKTLVIQ